MEATITTTISHNSKRVELAVDVWLDDLIVRFVTCLRSMAMTLTMKETNSWLINWTAPRSQPSSIIVKKTLPVMPVTSNLHQRSFVSDLKFVGPTYMKDSFKIKRKSKKSSEIEGLIDWQEEMRSETHQSKWKNLVLDEEQVAEKGTDQRLRMVIPHP